MKEDALLPGKPGADVRLRSLVFLVQECLVQQPGRSATAAEAMAHRVTGAEIFLWGKSRHFMKAAHQIRRQREQFFHLLRLFAGKDNKFFSKTDYFLIICCTFAENFTDFIN
jgi:hypothetical protein